MFAASALAANAAYNLNVWILFAVFLAAAVLGDTVNYEIGKRVGSAASTGKGWFGRLINRDKLRQAEAFFDKHGGKTIAIARFMPLIRTFAPFVSGGSRMHYGKFIHYNLLGGFLWVTLCVLGGFYFGNVTFVKEHFSLVALGIVLISLLPMVIAAVLRLFYCFDPSRASCRPRQMPHIITASNKPNANRKQSMKNPSGKTLIIGSVAGSNSQS